MGSENPLDYAATDRLGRAMDFNGMWLPQDQDPRMQEGPTRGEKECLVGYLEHYRGTLALKCDGLDDDLVRESHALWEDEIAYAREVLDRTDLDTVVDVHGEPTEVRDIIVHMIEEYARHCGHADLVRECIDGRAGQ